MARQATGHHREELSAPEVEFLRRWRAMVDRLGGGGRGAQGRAATQLNWKSSTMSRYCTGETLPPDKRLFQLGKALQLSQQAVLDLASLLRQARTGCDHRSLSRASRTDRLAASGTTTYAGPSESATAVSGNPADSLDQSTVDAGMRQSVETAAPDNSALRHSAEPLGRRAHFRGLLHGRRGLAVVLCVAAAAVVAAVLVLRLSGLPTSGQPASHSQSASGVRGSFPGMTVESVQIPVRSLTPALAAQFRQGRTAHATTVTGFAFRNHAAAGLCLTVPDTGAEAGQNRDPIVVSACRGTANQVWIPLQWEVLGFRFTHLVSDRYQSMCLNGNNLGGLSNGHIVELWDCYPAGNEAWDFGAWHAAAGVGARSYPLFARDDRLCLDADKWDLHDGTSVRVWTQYATANQFWS